MRLYNTLSQRVEPLDFPDGVVKMYVCGITPYDTSHLGHARVSVVYDTLRRFLEHKGLRVKYVQNITDIDEPLFERARRDGVDWRELGAQQTRRYLDSLALLNVEKPEYYVPATSVIPQMLPIIQRLIDLERAYVVNGTVYYRAASEPHFGEIAHTDTETLLAMANEMGNNPDDPQKIDPLDFILWQPSQADEPFWDSPWGPGRPGWHIECSTMATEYLGPQVDIHGGGADLIFPHHACEIAQTEPVTGVRPFVRCWMHTGLVSLGGTKMSKSLGNMVFVAELVERYSAAALRMAILSYPYRAPFEYDDRDVEQAQHVVDRIRRLLTSEPTTVSAESSYLADYEQQFFAALENDFDTGSAIKVLCDVTEALGGGGSIPYTQQAQQHLKLLTDVLGLKI